MTERILQFNRAEIIGNGDIATALKEIKKDLKPKLYFASGVSNSAEMRESEYERERQLLFQQDNTKHIVYFGSLAVFYSDTRYTRHKLEMEEAIKEIFDAYTIIRLGNITFGDNPNTLINALRLKLKEGDPLEIRDTTRYIIDKEEFHHWMRLVPDWNCEMNLTGQPMKVAEIVKKYVL